MKIFISWSGERSKAVAESLREWLPDVVSNILTWVSSADIDAGARWNHEVQRELGETSFGVVCLTRTNPTAPWLLFEAGALAKGVERSHLCPYLIDLEAADIPPGPLTQFQAKRADEEGTWDLVRTINAALGESGVTEDRLRRRFEAHWSVLRDFLADLPRESGAPLPKRSVDQKLDEILALVRAQGQAIDASQHSRTEQSQAIVSPEITDRFRAFFREPRTPQELREDVARILYNDIVQDPQVLATGLHVIAFKGTEEGPVLLVLKNGRRHKVAVSWPGFEHLTGNQLAAEVHPQLVQGIERLAKEDDA